MRFRKDSGADPFLNKKEADKLPPQLPLLTPRQPVEVSLPPLPTKLSTSMERQFFQIGNAVASFPWTPPIKETFDALNHKGFMWRAINFQLVKPFFSSKTTRIVVHGPVGVGKSCVLYQTVDFLRSSEDVVDKVIVLLPRAARWTAGYYAYSPSPTHPGMFDQIQLAEEILDGFQRLNPNYKLPNLEGSPVDILLALFNSLPKNSLVVVDDVNALFAPTAYRDKESKPLIVDNLSVVRAVRDMVLDEKRSVLAAVCSSNPALVDTKLRKNTIKGANWIEVPYFNAEDVRSVLLYYQQLGQVFEDVDLKLAHKMKFVSGGCGKKLLDAMHYNSVYRMKK